MSHRASIYSVRIRPSGVPSGWRLLGDYDSKGTWAGDTILTELQGLNAFSADGNVHANHESDLATFSNDYVGISILSGRTGVTSVLQKPGANDFFRTAAHSEAMRSGVLFYLPRGRDRGIMALHSPHGRGCKAIIERVLRDHFSNRSYIIDLSPVIPVDALNDALEQSDIKKITLIKYTTSRNDKFHEAAQWGSDEIGRLEFTITSRRRRSLRADPLERLLRNPSDDNRKQLLEFAGLDFDDVGVTVKFPGNVRRTFYLASPSKGYGISLDIDIRNEDQYGALADEISEELHFVVDYVYSDD